MSDPYNGISLHDKVKVVDKKESPLYYSIDNKVIRGPWVRVVWSVSGVGGGA